MTDEELRFWQEIDMHLTEVAKQPGWQALKEYTLNYLSNPTSTRVLNASEKTYTWETYLSDKGYLKGLRDVLEVPRIVNEKVANEIARRDALNE